MTTSTAEEKRSAFESYYRRRFGMKLKLHWVELPGEFEGYIDNDAESHWQTWCAALESKGG
jgi:hypothetical protein